MSRPEDTLNMRQRADVEQGAAVLVNLHICADARFKGVRKSNEAFESRISVARELQPS